MKRFLPHDEKRAAVLGTRGVTTPGCLVLLVLIVVLGYVGIKLGDAFWTYYNVREQIREAVIWAAAGQPKQDITVIQKTVEYAQNAGVKLYPRNIRVMHTTASLTIIAGWTHDLELFSFTYPLPFEVKLTEVKRWGRGGLVIK